MNFEVFAICLYNSLNLKNYCKKVILIKNSDSKNLCNILKKIDPSSKMNILIGSGFAETISQDIASNRNNYGNNFETIKKTKSKIFFEELQKQKITFPGISNKPEENGKWLVKEYQSFGGIKVKPFKGSHNINKKEYLQKFIDGDSISVQFFVEKNNIKVLAICDQIITNSKKGSFLIKSIITKKIQNKLLKIIYNLVKKISKIFFLKGINNLDLIIQGKKVFLLEINPRPGLSTNILNSIHKNLFKIKTSKKKNTFNGYYSSTVIYSRKEIKINNKKKLFLKKISHSKQFSELPNLGDIIMVDEPICLLHLKSKNRIFLDKKIEKIQSNFLNKIEEV